MTDRINGFYVALGKDIRDDDFESIMQAVLMIKGVIGVDANVTDVNTYTAELRANQRWENALYDLIKGQEKLT